MGFARDVADRVMVMDGGLIVEIGPPANIFSNPAQARTADFLAPRSSLMTAVETIQTRCEIKREQRAMKVFGRRIALARWTCLHCRRFVAMSQAVANDAGDGPDFEKDRKIKIGYIPSPPGTIKDFIERRGHGVLRRRRALHFQDNQR